MALEMLQPGERVLLRSVLGCLEAEFYSDAKQTAMGLVFNMRIRQHGVSEREYAKALQSMLTKTTYNTISSADAASNSSLDCARGK